MSRLRTPPDSERCMHTDSIGRRCRCHRLAGDYTLCYVHWNNATRPTGAPAQHPLIVATRLLPPGTHLESADAVRILLTGVMREVLEGNLNTKQAAALGYLGQTVLQSIAQGQKAAASESQASAHPILHTDPEAAIQQITSSLQTMLSPEDEKPAPHAAAAVAPAPETQEPSEVQKASASDSAPSDESSAAEPLLEWRAAEGST